MQNSRSFINSSLNHSTLNHSSLNHSNPSHRLLIVEHDHTLRTLYQKILQSDDLIICGASSGEEALASLVAFQPDLILTALKLPGISGIEFIRNVRLLDSGNSIGIIALSPCSDRATLKRICESGVDTPLTMPFDLSKLRSTVRLMLGSRAVDSLLPAKYAQPSPETEQAWDSKFELLAPTTKPMELSF